MAATAIRASSAFWMKGMIKERAGGNVEDPFDHHRIVPRHPKNRFGSASAHRLKLRHNGWYIVRSMFAVENNPIEASTGDDLGCDVAAQAAPKPNASPAL